MYFSSCDGDSILVPDTRDNGIGGCFVSLRGRPRAPGIFAFTRELGLCSELIRLRLTGGLVDEVCGDLLGGLTDDLENVGDEKSFAKTNINSCI